ncbi:hypothetical protein [Xanthomonas campestris]|uniref:hypothetical protein n=1 Tax=Xanthomonas campestris TaxID=339 RepID=UPI001E4825F7|nr:hypothetical protein [Xanthomonas campestris]MCC5064051.1 hypothetical protein [Xanthomonas campestris pv. raphani]MEA9890489.1 hypothetical protein [Xanthomonas campestris pv. raphani]MEA9974903.1 hypothetical protein [Xanthomonas campestris pv. raphani]
MTTPKNHGQQGQHPNVLARFSPNCMSESSGDHDQADRKMMINEPRELTPAEIETLREDMGRSIGRAQAELKRRRVMELSRDELAELRRDMAESSAWIRTELAARKSRK